MKTIKDYLDYLERSSSFACLCGNFELDLKSSLMCRYNDTAYIWLTEYLTTLTPKELLTYHSLGLVVTNKYHFNRVQNFINFLTEIVNNEQKHSSPISS